MRNQYLTRLRSYYLTLTPMEWLQRLCKHFVSKIIIVIDEEGVNAFDEFLVLSKFDIVKPNN